MKSGKIIRIENDLIIIRIIFNIFFHLSFYNFLNVSLA